MKRIPDSQEKRTVLNISFSLCYQIVSVVCGVLIPNLMIKKFGSELYGVSTSILQFLSYITLLEGGVGGVARAALYKPLAEKNDELVSDIIREIKGFYKVVAYIFIVYVLILACSFSKISRIESLDWLSTFALVLIMSLSTLAQYYFGVSYTVLIIADQRNYVSDFISILNMILNTVLIVVLVYIDCSFLIVKLVSSCVFVLRPVLLAIYVRRNYSLGSCKNGKERYLKQKWVGLGQHIAYFLYSNTDVVVLTLFSNLRIVAVYSVYSLICTSMQSLILSFCSGMEANFGFFLVKNEKEKFLRVFENYETLVSIIATTLLSVTVVMILPFIGLYTAGVNDVNYIEPLFSVLMVAVVFVSCVREPYNCLVVAAGAFLQTQAAAYGEAVLNVVVSILLVGRFGLVGVAIGTLIAVVYRTVYHVVFLSRNILLRPMHLFFKRQMANAFAFLAVWFLGRKVVSLFSMTNYIKWIICSSIVTAIAVACVLLINLMFYPKTFNNLRDFLAKKNRSKA